MSLIVPAVLGGLALAVMALVSFAAARKGKHPSASLPQAQTNQPRILIHSINEDRCVGCDACVAVCPTNVLDLIDNKSRVVRFQDCIQCEQCMWACPTEALVMHLEGTEPPPLKVPEVDPNFQTAVPGQYLIGEVAGKPLVKNAANLGRLVVEHMLRQGGMRPGAGGPGVYDVAVVGSGPAGLSAALTCVQRGLSYVVLEKEQLVASTISRYPKGKWVMAEPYDVRNLSLLPVFDSTKEQMVPIWQDLVKQVSVQIKMGETTETVAKAADGNFDIQTTVNSYRAQRVILATGTRGKPRTLGVPGENLPKVHFLLEDPDEFRGKAVLVVGGGDSAVEAAMALADSGARVVISYRSRSFNRCSSKNKQKIEAYDAQKRVKIRYQSGIAEFTEDTVTLQMANGERKTYPNEAAFVLIGADPPIKWLNKQGVQFVERPHSYALGKTDELLLQLMGDEATDCPEDTVLAAAQVRGEKVSPQVAAAAAAAAASASMTMIEPVSGPRKWLRSATQIFSAVSADKAASMSLTDLTKRKHSGRGRRDALDPVERTRILRMLRDEGGRLADEESRVEFQASLTQVLQAMSPQQAEAALAPISAAKSGSSVSPLPGPLPNMSPGMMPPPPPQPQAAYNASPMPTAGPGQKTMIGVMQNAQSSGKRPSVLAMQSPGGAASFNDEPTRQVDADSQLAKMLRDQARSHRPHQPQVNIEEEATRAVNFDAHGLMASVPEDEEPTAMANYEQLNAARLAAARDEESTRTVDVRSMERQAAAMKKGPAVPGDQNRPTSLSDIDWDLD